MFSIGDLVTTKTGIYKINYINKKGHIYLIGIEGQPMQVCSMSHLKILMYH